MRERMEKADAGEYSTMKTTPNCSAGINDDSSATPVGESNISQSDGAVPEVAMSTVIIDDNNDGGDNDDDLRAALELSMHPVDHEEFSKEEKKSANSNEENSEPNYGAAATNAKAPKKSYDLIEKDFDCVSFHRLMWDDAISTANDKERWIYECITTTFIQTRGNPPFTAPITANPCSPFHGSSHDYQREPVNPLEYFTGSIVSNESVDGNLKSEEKDLKDESDKLRPLPQQLWGLTQKHGGPCGVLAAIQAEIIRLLLFGRKTQKENCNDNGKSLKSKSNRCLFFPFSPSDSYNFGEKRNGDDRLESESKYGTQDTINSCMRTPITPAEVDEAMAMAIGMILARASITPPASEDSSAKKRVPPCVRLVFPKNRSDEINKDGHNSTVDVKPNESFAQSNNSWIREMLNCSSKNQDGSASASSSDLKVHTITHHKILTPTLTNQGLPIDNKDVDENNSDNDASPETKRQRKKSVSFSLGNNPGPDKPTASHEEEIEMAELAHTVADFLLGLDNDTVESNPHPNIGNSPKPLDFFQGPGGVMFFVMSLVESRGIENIRSGE